MSALFPRLLGVWRTDPNDVYSMREYGDVSLEFLPNGELVYTINLSDRQQIFRLTYHVQDNYLLTDQPSAPKMELNEFFFTVDGRLAIKESEQGCVTYYVRQI